MKRRFILIGTIWTILLLLVFYFVYMESYRRVLYWRAVAISSNPILGKVPRAITFEGKKGYDVIDLDCASIGVSDISDVVDVCCNDGFLRISKDGISLNVNLRVVDDYYDESDSSEAMAYFHSLLGAASFTITEREMREARGVDFYTKIAALANKAFVFRNTDNFYIFKSNDVTAFIADERELGGWFGSVKIEDNFYSIFVEVEDGKSIDEFKELLSVIKFIILK